MLTTYGFSHVGVSTHDMNATAQDVLEFQGAGVGDMTDLGYIKATFFFDPNGVQLAFGCQTRPFDNFDRHKHSDAKVEPSEYN